MQWENDPDHRALEGIGAVASIFKRNNIYYVSYYVDGRRKKKAIGKSKKIAELALKDIEVKLAKNRIGIIDKNKDLKKFVEEYLSYSASNKAKSTFKRDKVILNKSFLPNIQVNNLSKVSPQILEQYKIERLKSVKDMTVNRELITIKAMFTKAVEWQYLDENPATRVKLFKVRKDERPRFLSKEEIQRLLDTCSEGLYPFVYTALNTGLRSSELVYLRWKDVNLENRKITVYSRDDWQTKSGKSRNIDINDNLLIFFKKYKHQGSEYVFCTKDGRPLVNNLNRRFKNAVKRAELERVSIHTLRHTFASHLVMAGVPLATVSTLLGHSDIKTTMIYAHLSPDHLKNAVNKLNF